MNCFSGRPVSFHRGTLITLFVATLLPWLSATGPTPGIPFPPNPVDRSISIYQNSAPFLPERLNHAREGAAVTLGVGLIPGDQVQWFLNDSAIPGAIYSEYQILSVQSSHAGNYLAEITRNGVVYPTEILVLNVANAAFTTSAVDTSFLFNFGNVGGHNPIKPRIMSPDGTIGAIEVDSSFRFFRWQWISPDGMSREIIEERFSPEAPHLRGMFVDGSILRHETDVVTLVSADGATTIIPGASDLIASTRFVQKQPAGNLILTDSINVTGLNLAGEVIFQHNVGSYGVITISGLETLPDTSDQILLIGDSIDDSGEYAKLAMPLGPDGLPPAQFRPIIHHGEAPIRLSNGTWALIDQGKFNSYDDQGRLLRQQELPHTPGEWVIHPHGELYLFIYDLGIARFDANLNRDESFFVSVPPRTIFDSANTLFAADGSLIVSGTFSSLDGHPTTGVGRISPTRSPANSAPLVGLEIGPTPQHNTPVEVRAFALGSGPFSYEWLSLDGAALPVANAAANLSFPQFGAHHTGRYQLQVRGPFGTTRSEVVDFRLSAPPLLSNLSGRGFVSAPSTNLIAGFVVDPQDDSQSPNGTGYLLLRGVGPTLNRFNVANFLSDPVLEWQSLASGQVRVNDDWAPLSADIKRFADLAGVFPLDPLSTDAHLLTAMAPGSFISTVKAKPDTSGIALAEIHSLATSGESHSLANLSLRGQIGAGDNVLIGGFIIRDPADFDRPLRVLIRAIGPSLADFGVESVCPDPVLTLFNQSGEIIATNEQWFENTVSLSEIFKQVGAFPLAAGSLDAAILMELPPGAYTAHIGSKSTSGGEALLEIYRLPYSQIFETTP